MIYLSSKEISELVNPHGTPTNTPRIYTCELFIN